MEFNELINKICSELPIGYDIEIPLENGYGDVILNCAETSKNDVISEFTGNTLEEKLLNALAYAAADVEG